MNTVAEVEQVRNHLLLAHPLWGTRACSTSMKERDTETGPQPAPLPLFCALWGLEFLGLLDSPGQERLPPLWVWASSGEYLRVGTRFRFSAVVDGAGTN